jgi:hypothetical protein
MSQCSKYITELILRWSLQNNKEDIKVENVPIGVYLGGLLELHCLWKTLGLDENTELQWFCPASHRFYDMNNIEELVFLDAIIDGAICVKLKSVQIAKGFEIITLHDGRVSVALVTQRKGREHAAYGSVSESSGEEWEEPVRTKSFLAKRKQALLAGEEGEVILISNDSEDEVFDNYSESQPKRKKQKVN